MKIKTSQTAWEMISGHIFLYFMNIPPQNKPPAAAAMISKGFSDQIETRQYNVVVINNAFVWLYFRESLCWTNPRQNISSAGPIQNSNANAIKAGLLPFLMP